MFYELIQVGILLLLTFYFLKDYKKSHKYLLLGYGFFFISLLLQLPFYYLEVLILNFLTSPSFIPSLLLSTIAIIISELTKYFSLKRFLPSKNMKAGKAFVFAWVSLESLNFLTIWFYTHLFSFFNMNFSFSPYILDEVPLMNFILFLLFNLAVSMLVLKSVIKNKIMFLLFAIALSISIPIIISLTSGLSFYFLVIFIMLYSLSLIYRFWR